MCSSMYILHKSIEDWGVWLAWQGAYRTCMDEKPTSASFGPTYIEKRAINVIKLYLPYIYTWSIYLKGVDWDTRVFATLYLYLSRFYTEQIPAFLSWHNKKCQSRIDKPWQWLQQDSKPMHTHAYLKIFWAFDIFFNTAIHLKQNTFCEVWRWQVDLVSGWHICKQSCVYYGDIQNLPYDPVHLPLKSSPLSVEIHHPSSSLALMYCRWVKTWYVRMSCISQWGVQASGW